MNLVAAQDKAAVEHSLHSVPQCHNSNSSNMLLEAVVAGLSPIHSIPSKVVVVVVANSTNLVAVTTSLTVRRLSTTNHEVAPRGEEGGHLSSTTVVVVVAAGAAWEVDVVGQQ